MEEQIIEHLTDQKNDKSQKREIERQEVLNNAVGGKIDNVRDRVAFILNNSVSARNSDTELAWIYWETFERNMFNGNSITKDDMKVLTKISSLTRIRAKIQNEYKLFQADDKVKKFRGVLEDDKRQEAISDKPSYPFYTIYIDETGKTQKYLSVGSLWLTNDRDTFFGYFKLKEWKEQRQIDFEFHFSEMKNEQLDIYKAFFRQFLIFNPSCGFKVIIIDRTGFKDLNSAITDLTFHLVVNGINHEHSTNRAPLPRRLQVRIDNEETGSDRLKVENIKERIIGQRLEGLEIDSIEPIDSKDNIYMQAVDLFIASINRKLHNPESSGKPKDELADYILNLLGFDIEEIDKTNSEADKSQVFNLTSTETPSV